MSDIAKLTVALYANSAQFVSELDKSNKKAKTWSSQVKGSFSVAAAATAAAATAAAGAIALIYNQQAAVIDQTAKFADRIGISTEALTQFRHASELTGVGAKNLDMSLQRMTRRIAEAEQGAGEAAPALKELGLSADELGRMTPDQQLYALADAFTEVESQSARVRLAFKLFDSEGVGMVNMLTGGAEGLRAMADEADRLGITLSRVEAAKVEMANDAMYKVDMLTSSIAQSMTTEIAPIVAQLADDFLRAAQSAGGMSLAVADVVDVSVSGFGYMGNAWRGWEIIIATLKFRVTELAYTIQTSIQSASDFVHDAGKAMFSPIMESIWQALDALGSFSDSAASAAASMRAAMDAPAPQWFADLPQITLEYSQAQWELQQLLAKPLPSTSADEWLKNVRAAAQEAAEIYANGVNRNDGTDGDGTGDTKGKKPDPAIATFQEGTKQLEVEYQRRLAVQAAGEQAAYTQEAFAYADRQAQLSEQFQAAYEAAANNQVLQQELEDQYFASRELLWQDHQSRLTEIELAEQKKRRDYQARTAADLLTFTQQQMQITMGVLADAGQESSALYKMLFAVQKAAAIPSMIVATEEAAIKAMAAFPGPAGVTMAGAVRAMGYASVGMVGAQAIMGMAHDGIDSVPLEGTWLLDKGERVYTNESAQKIDSMYGRVMGGTNGNQQTSSSQPWTINIYDAPAGTTAEVDDEKRVIAIMMKDANSGGQYISYIQQKLGVRPGGYK
ncbi:hypothetical protein HJ155_23030 [Vibrio parahaemolyticus]|nr:hypothetical protein [Vibrio parahaemolyticus]